MSNANFSAFFSRQKQMSMLNRKLSHSISYYYCIEMKSHTNTFAARQNARKNEMIVSDLHLRKGKTTERKINSDL